MLFFYAPPETLNFGTTIIQKVTEVRDLGLMVDYQLKFEEHVKLIRQKIGSHLDLLKSQASHLPRKVKLQMFYAFIQSHVDFCLPIWYTCNASLRDQIQQSLKYGLRWVFGAKANLDELSEE